MAGQAAESFREWAREEQRKRGGVSGIVLSQEEVARFLATQAILEASENFCHDPGCDACNSARRTWWNLCNALELRYYEALVEILSDSHTPLPEGPWEEVGA